MKYHLNNLRHDLPASIVVFFVALPLCLGIALASGAPLFSGIIAGIVGGIVVGLASGSRFGVSGPAAGLAVIVLSYVTTLGSWENFLVATVLAGIIQVAMGFMRLGTIAYYFPSSVINGMLAGIGIIIIIKQIPHALGYDAPADNNFVESLTINNILDLERTASHLTPAAIIISVISLTLLISWESFLAKKHKIFRLIQGPLAVVIFGIIASTFLDLHDHQIVQLPVAGSFNEFISQFTLPNFDQLRNHEIYAMALVIALVASIETLLSVEAIDNLDPSKHVTPTNRELKAQGLGNIISGMIGGLPITQVIVRSSANLQFGAKTKMSTVIHGFLLLIAVITIPGMLNMIPLASLACILLFLGYKLAKPAVFRKAYDSGLQNFVPFVATIGGMIALDLLKGVAIGIAVAMLYRIKKTDSAVLTLTKETRDSLTPKEAVKILEEGNERFVNNLKANRNLLKQVNDTSEGQHPFAIILSCIDSRTSAELIFDQGLGDIFSCRIAGNVLNDDILGSMEFACKFAGAKLIMVLGHTGCGAIKGACDEIKTGHLTNLLEKINPAIKNEKATKEHRNSSNNDFVDNVAEINVTEVLKQIPKQSAIIKDMIEKEQIAVIGGMYNVGTGVVKFYKD
jgi:MFS superfamily sulfate permease-like transporter